MYPEAERLQNFVVASNIARSHLLILIQVGGCFFPVTHILVALYISTPKSKSRHQWRCTALPLILAALFFTGNKTRSGFWIGFCHKREIIRGLNFLTYVRRAGRGQQE
jgi:hypothetical protein